MNLIERLDYLIEQWCERRALRPIQLLFRAYPGTLTHTDQFACVLDALRDVKGLCRDQLTAGELQIVIESINELEDFVAARLGSPTKNPRRGGE